MGCAGSKPVEMVDDELSVVDFLSQNSFFKGLSNGQVTTAASKFSVRRFGVGERIITQGDKADELFLIAKGAVDFIAVGEDGKAKRIRMMSANEAFGEFGLVFDTPRSVSVDAVTDVVLLVLSRAAYEKSKGDSCMKNMARWVNATASSIVASGLSEVPFLSDVSEKQLALIGRLFNCEVVPRGTVVAQEGEAGDRFYILSRGTLAVTTQDELGLYVELTRLKPGATFGELSLLKDQPRNATVTALEECVLFSLGREEFSYFVRSLPELGERLERSVNERATVTVISEKVPVFQSLSKRKQHLLAEVCTMHRHGKGEVILKEGGSEPRSFFIITRGAVEVYVGGEKVRELRAGDYFGEVSLVSESTHSATVRVADNDDAYMLECSQEDFKSLFVGEPTVLAEISLRVLGTRAPLTSVLGHHVGREVFMKHVSKEFATENVDFWVAVEALESVGKRRIRKSILGALSVDPSTISGKKSAMLAEQAQAIYEKFIDEDAPSQVNLPDPIVAAIKAKMEAEKYDYKMFAEAKKEVVALMSKDTFARFQQSDGFAELLSRIGVYEQKRPDE